MAHIHFSTHSALPPGTDLRRPSTVRAHLARAERDLVARVQEPTLWSSITFSDGILDKPMSELSPVTPLMAQCQMPRRSNFSRVSWMSSTANATWVRVGFCFSLRAIGDLPVAPHEVNLGRSLGLADVHPAIRVGEVRLAP
jgi:hypothetical protein